MIRMSRASRFDILEKSVVQDRNFLCTTVSYAVTFVVFLNLNNLQSPLLGLMSFIIYFVINAMFLGNALFRKEETFLRLMFGILLLTMFLGFIGWLTLIIYNLDATRVTLVLFVVATLSSLFNRRRVRRINGAEYKRIS